MQKYVIYIQNIGWNFFQFVTIFLTEYTLRRIIYVRFTRNGAYI